MFPKVSIVIPTYNRARYLPEALESALAQTYPNIEIVVVNDGSTDETETVLAPYMKHINYIKQENGGCPAAKNTGLAVSTGEFITNLDDDDRIHSEKIARQIEMFQERPHLGICGTGVHFIDAQGKQIEPFMSPQFYPKTQVLQLLRGCLLVQPSMMIRRKVHDHLGNYKLVLSEDYEFWLRVSLHYEIGVVEEYLTDYRIHGNQITGPKTRPQLRAAVEQIVRNFIRQTPMELIIPELRAYSFGYVLIGLLLCEQKLNRLAQSYFERVLPNPVGYFGLGLLRLHEWKLAEAIQEFEQVKASDSPFASKALEALVLVERAQTISKNLKNYHNKSPHVVRLRKELSFFHATIIRLLLRLARGRS